MKVIEKLPNVWTDCAICRKETHQGIEPELDDYVMVVCWEPVWGSSVARHVCLDCAAKYGIQEWDSFILGEYGILKEEPVL